MERCRYICVSILSTTCERKKGELHSSSGIFVIEFFFFSSFAYMMRIAVVRALNMTVLLF